MSIKTLKGFLVSQIGYEPDHPKRVMMRSTDRAFLSDGAVCRILDEGGKTASECPWTYWGEIWGSHWWIAEFSSLQKQGTYTPVFLSDGKESLRGDAFHMGKDILWDSTWLLTGVDQLERRTKIAKVPPGWYDAGTLWQELNSHAATVRGLCDTLLFAKDRMDAPTVERFEKQVLNGCDYMAACQDEAARRGHGEGAFSHDLLSYMDVILPANVSKAAMALACAARTLGPRHAAKKKEYVGRAEKALVWLAREAKPLGALGFSIRQNGWPEGSAIPNEWMTRDLWMTLWANVELALGGKKGLEDVCADLAGTILKRQVSKTDAEDGLYGHFYLFEKGPVTEKAWAQGILYETPDGKKDRVFGADIGATFANCLFPLIEMLRLWPDHVDAKLWKKALEDFAYGYLLPACRRSPFLILPQGVFGKEGLLYFAGLWHAMNAVYGQTAALAWEFQRLFKDDAFDEIATGNLQWIAGLNAGLTRSAAKTAYLSSIDIPEGRALPVSFINGVGNRWAGTWLNTRGAICNGFGTGEQFQHDVVPSRSVDGPHAFHDEDWITHGAGWMSAVARRRSEVR